MTAEEKAEKYLDEHKECTQLKGVYRITVDEKQIYLDGLAEGRKENEELKKEISALLSCANCPENKGGYICEREYNDKCLAQKIEYIKELKEENAELKKYCDCRYCKNYDCGDEVSVESTNKTLCVNCIENNKKFFEGKE